MTLDPMHPAHDVRPASRTDSGGPTSRTDGSGPTSRTDGGDPANRPEEPPVRYAVQGAVATITLNRPQVANAQDSALIDALDAAFDRAEDDDAVRVVVLAAAGRHFSAGHDLRSLVGDTHDPWRAMRATPEGKFRHEQVMYVDRCRRIRDFPKPTIAAVHGKCVAAGLMLACMCDIIVAADDASFSNPVLRMTGAGVELLVEPWELGIRKAKEFLLAAEELDAHEAWRLGLVNRVVPAAELAAAVHQLAERIALVPPVTARTVKASLNHTADLMGQDASWRYHFMAHQWVHNTETAQRALAERQQMGSLREVFAARDRGDAPVAAEPAEAAADDRAQANARTAADDRAQGGADPRAQAGADEQPVHADRPTPDRTEPPNEGTTAPVADVTASSVHEP
jgi:enoyl-CoA hydratase